MIYIFVLVMTFVAMVFLGVQLCTETVEWIIKKINGFRTVRKTR